LRSFGAIPVAPQPSDRSLLRTVRGTVTTFSI
jgi:hypothetical protein